MSRSRIQASSLAALSISLLLGAACGTAGITNPTNGGNNDPNYIYGGQSQGGSGGGTVDPSLTASNQNVAIGFELSALSAATGQHPVSDTNFWLASARTLAAKVPSSTMGARLVVGTYSKSRGSVEFAFPRPQSTTTRESKAVSFADTDAFDALLSALDGINAAVILEVQPGYADLTDLADAMYAAYGQHKSVAGISFDLAYYRSASSLTDATAQALVGFVAGKNANLSVEVRSNDVSDFPSNGLSGLTYVYDTINRTSLSSITTAEKNFASTFVKSPVKFIVGASGQRGAVCSMVSPEIAMLSGALQAGSTVRGIYWSGATVATLSPGTGFACSDTSNSETGDSSSSNSGNSSNNGGSTNNGSANNSGNSSNTGSNAGTGASGGSTGGTTDTNTGSSNTGTGAGTVTSPGSTGTGATVGTGTTGTGTTGTGTTGGNTGSAGSTPTTTAPATGTGTGTNTNPGTTTPGSTGGGTTTSTPGSTGSAGTGAGSTIGTSPTPAPVAVTPAA